MSDMQLMSKKIEKLNERDFLIVSTLVDTLLDPEWVLLSAEDIKDIEIAERDFKEGNYTTLEDFEKNENL